jgi:hypothetical protein
VGMAFHRIHFLANETPSSKSLNHFDINKGRTKEIDYIAGCLLAFACELAFERGYFGFVSLQPKTQLIDLYQNRYGFPQYGRLLAVEQASAKQLIDKYL